MKMKIELLSNLLRKLEANIGTRDVLNMLLLSLLDSFKNLEVKNSQDFYCQFKELAFVLSQTEPKFGIINYHIANLLRKFSEQICIKGEKDWLKFATNEIENILKNGEQGKKALMKYADKLNVEGKTILIHDHSHTVQDVLAHLKYSGRKFNVIIAEQNFDKTQSNIERLTSAEIPFQVVPSYMLSHIHEQIDMLFFGALTLKDTMDFVMDPGTHGIISEFHIVHKPVYMFIDTSKFSLWKSQKRTEVFMRKHEYEHSTKNIKYEKIKYSHDRVPAELFHKIVTNEGVFDLKGIKALFDKKFEGYKETIEFLKANEKEFVVC